jgi:phage/plasmid-like protein (TIGR03299 family)
VEKRPLYRGVNLDAAGLPQDYVASTEGWSIVRTDRNAELGVVGPSYKPLQNRDAFRALVPLLDNGVAKLDTGGTLRGGADAWLSARFDLSRLGPVVQEVFGDEIIPYAVIRCNHVGRRETSAMVTPVRIVCANTLGMAEDGATKDTEISVKHVGDVEVKILEAADKLFGGLVTRYEAVAAQYKMLKAVELDMDIFRRTVLDVVAPDPRKNKRFNPEARMAELVVERHEAKVREATRLWTQGKGHTGDHSAWEAYNGAVEMLDHNVELYPTKAGVYRTQSALDGVIGTMKQEVLNRLVAVAESATN